MIPLLILGYSRPQSIQRVLQQVEELEKTYVIISLDGMDLNTSINLKSQILKTQDICHEWKRNSKHKVDILIQSSNLGCNLHTITAIRKCVERHGFGLLLEDDCEFVNDYVLYLNDNVSTLISSSIHSLCGWALDWKNDLSAKPTSEIIEFQKSKFMGASLGMTFNSNSLDNFDQSLRELDLQVWDYKIEKAIRKSSCNFMQKLVLIDFWQNKIRSCINTWDRQNPNYDPHKENGWDARWQLSAFLAEKDFLIPTWTVSRESLYQDEGQWHEHAFNYPAWDSKIVNIQFASIRDISKISSIKVKRITGLGLKRLPIYKFLKILLKKIRYR